MTIENPTAREYLEESLSYFDPQFSENEDGFDVRMPHWIPGSWLGASTIEQTFTSACTVGGMMLARLRLRKESFTDLRDDVDTRAKTAYYSDPEFRKAAHALLMVIPSITPASPFGMEFRSQINDTIEEIEDRGYSPLVLNTLIAFNDAYSNEKTIWTLFTTAIKSLTEEPV